MSFPVLLYLRRRLSPTQNMALPLTVHKILDVKLFCLLPMYADITFIPVGVVFRCTDFTKQSSSLGLSNGRRHEPTGLLRHEQRIWCICDNSFRKI